MLKIHFQTQILKLVQNGVQLRYLYLFENLLIINKQEGLKLIDRKFDLSSSEIQIKWTLENNNFKEMAIYNTKLNQKLIYSASSQILNDLYEKLNGKAFYKGFRQFYQKLETIRSHKNVEISKCRNLFSDEIFVAKTLKFCNKQDENQNVNLQIYNEAKILMKLVYFPHKYLLSIHQIFISDFSIVLVMKLCKGGTLFDYVCENDLMLPEFVTQEMMKNLLSGISHLHQLGIMHRDIKLDNIMLLNKNQPDSICIIDFGYSTYINDQILIHQRCGTPGYIAPEIIKMQKYNELCDIYSLGCVFHILLTGKKLESTSLSTKSSDYSAAQNPTNTISFSKICNINGLDLLQLMLSKNTERPTAEQCLKHCYFEEETFVIEEIQTQIRELKFPSFKNPFQL